jgi:hypothetical protein
MIDPSHFLTQYYRVTFLRAMMRRNMGCCDGDGKTRTD